MRIAVAIPCYNGAKYIKDCLNSIIAQTRPADSILVVDDGSSDESSAIISQFPVKLINHEFNHGLSVARNTALDHADADLMVYLDADTIAESQLLANIEKTFHESNAHGVGGQGIEVVRRTVFDQWRTWHAAQGYGDKPKFNCDFLYGICMSYKIQTLRSVGGFDPRLKTNAEDVDIGFRLVDQGYKLMYTPLARVFHQKNDDEISLRKAMYRWYYWGYIVKYKNKRQPWTLYFGVFRRLFWSDTWPDLLVRRNLELVNLDFKLSLVKLKAILDASRVIRQNIPWENGIKFP